jgi:hypothetical protein
VVVNVQFDFAVLDVCRGSVAAPVTSTHFVSLDVTTVSVSAAPCLAYTVPPTDTVPAPPEKTALETLDPEAMGALTTPANASIAVTGTISAERNADRLLRAPAAERGERRGDTAIGFPPKERTDARATRRRCRT